MKAQYPEHEKLHEIRDKSQVVGEFLEWAAEKGISLCQADPNYTGEYSPYWPVRLPRGKLLAEFCGIDLDKLEEEKTAMLTKLREEQAP